uniref:DUF86 domain-containing protein n=1 Tax=Candidatus Kentrum sp. LPFa TaxID=2126335 RepID=A0A450WHP8_9GAMM|nr:MAG: Protein of unknown function DUF86 [Candidatus Kentron sp. LPFa]
MPKREDGAVIRDMREAMDRIASYLSGMDYGDFLLDYRTQDAVIRNIEILGEAAKLLSDEAKSRYPDMPWRDIAGTRDRLIPNPESGTKKADGKYHFSGFLSFLIVLFRIFRESE